MKLLRNYSLIILLALFTASCGSSDGVYFENLTDGQEVSSTVLVEMGVKGMDVEPAGEVHKGKGHHHIIIDGGFMKTGETIPADKTHIHYGKGQTEATIELTPGKHTLTLQFANGLHQSYGEAWSKTITVNVID
ncbi:DUF4399 domain-containing protein [Roseivirga sp.]|uniref:DUF4399 domain-containing protein n=1 Tax=Roseivirga sp. TaxID=1964215 RepID=UPI003B52F89D